MSEPVDGAINELAPEVYPDWYLEPFPPAYIEHRRAQGLPLREVNNEALYLMLLRIEKRIEILERRGE